MTTITATKRRLILRDMSAHEGMVVPSARVIQLASRHQVKAGDLTELLNATGYICATVAKAGSPC